MSLHTNSSPPATPWNWIPLSGFRQKIAYVACIVVFVGFLAGAVATVLGPLVLLGSGKPPSVAQVFALLLWWLPVGLLTVISFKAFATLNRTLEMGRWEERSKGRPIHFLWSSVLRSFGGFGAVTFGNDEAVLAGKMGPGLVGSLIALAVTEALFVAISVFVLTPIYLIVNPIWVLLIYNSVATRERSVTVQRQDIERADFRGLVVELHLAVAPVRGLRVLRMFVLPNSAHTFFSGFDKAFPGLMPDAYRQAVGTALAAVE